jgi:hypothetical protein
MYFQIKEIILWAKKSSFEPVRLKFSTQKVNVITGASRTGKSAIIPIVDYCLGSDKCAIPVKTIRDACEWFGVLIETPLGFKLFARREPGNQKATGDMFVIEGAEIEIPQRIPGKNASVDAIKRKLDEFVGLTNLDFDATDFGSSFKGRPSFRDLGAFLFQPQNIVANPDILFYKADTYEHREKLRTIFPYILNAVTADLLAKQHELSQLRKELRRKQRELANIKEISERWLAEIKSRAAEARELGLIKAPILATDTKDHLIELLSGVVSDTSLDIKVTSETVSEAVGELLQLQREESGMSLVVSGLRKRYAEMTALRESSKEYVGALQIQEERLKISEWLAKTHDTEHNCPICGNTIEKTTEQLKQLLNSLKEIESDAGEFDMIPAAFDREFERVRSELKEATEKLQGIRIRRQSLEKSSEEAKQRQYESLHVSRFVGNLEEALKMYSRIGTDNELASEVQEVQNRISLLESDISEGKIKSRIKRAIETINLFAGKLLPYLDCERPEDPISLSIDNLTIAVRGQDRDDYLWEIGSGSNWLSYHIAISLALQQFFLTIKESPVPSFLIYDQPSQVYFPKRLASREDDLESDPKFKDEDVEAVQKVFNVFSRVVENSKGQLQVIVLDHAPESVWGHISNIHMVAEWRGGKSLIPSDWLL